MKAKKKPDFSKRRTRYDPPTLDEAVFAAQGLTDDPDQQVLIAAQLMALPEHEVRPAVLKSRSAATRVDVQVVGARRAVVVERRLQRGSPRLRPPAE